MGKTSKTLFSLIAIYLFLGLFLGSLSYKFFIDDFISLEEGQNKDNITSFANILNEDLIDLEKITNDYSKWDETYSFIENRNDIFIYDNFRDDAQTLEDLGIDAFLFVDKNDNIVFSTYNKRINLFHINKKNLEKDLLSNLKKIAEVSTLYMFNNKLFYVNKSKILRSDFLGKYRGYILSIKHVDLDYLKQITSSIFDNIILENIEMIKTAPDISLALKHLKKVKAYVNIDDTNIANKIELFDYKNQYLTTFITSNRNAIILQGKRTIKVFNFIGAIILLIVFIVIFQKQKLIIEQNELLNEKVTKRTKQLTRAYRSLKVKNKELYKLAHTDFLTSIRNRANFFENSIRLLKKSNNENKKFAVLMIDIDYFKKINDTYGHDTGDKVLIEFCNIVNEIIQKDMIFGRLGGEEFAITIFNQQESNVYELSEKIRDKCATTLIKVKDTDIKFTISMGVVFKEDKKESIDEILHKADELLYTAKESGRNRVVRAV
ncbi:diguanylate cyclase [Halarcobacter sp.]|uniref:sensor domain-containing diguanylate cyclase n=1 Tax=Halarcobacter sp. TaxID=2321133 RepID=UPI0029F4FB94|nr:diguanylate cyclase [Halarcobacter sp.]